MDLIIVCYINIGNKKFRRHEVQKTKCTKPTLPALQYGVMGRMLVAFMLWAVPSISRPIEEVTHYNIPKSFGPLSVPCFMSGKG